MSSKRKSSRKKPALIRSWDGHEDDRDRVRAAAREINASLIAMRAAANYPDSVVAGLVLQNVRDPSIVVSNEVTRAGDAQRALRELMTELVAKGFDWYFVRSEWAPILASEEV